MKIKKENGVYSGTVIREDWNKLNYYEMIYSGEVKDGMLESTDYECIHKVRETKENEYMEQDENIGTIGCKIYFYRTFLLFEDGYSGNKYTFVYDKIY